MSLQIPTVMMKIITDRTIRSRFGDWFHSVLIDFFFNTRLTLMIETNFYYYDWSCFSLFQVSLKKIWTNCWATPWFLYRKKQSSRICNIWICKFFKIKDEYVDSIWLNFQSRKMMLQRDSRVVPSDTPRASVMLMATELFNKPSGVIECVSLSLSFLLLFLILAWTLYDQLFFSSSIFVSMSLIWRMKCEL